MKKESDIVPINYRAMSYLSWFMSDAQNLMNWSEQIFRSDIDLNNAKLPELVAASENALNEIEDDVVQIRAFLAEYIPPVTKVTKD